MKRFDGVTSVAQFVNNQSEFFTTKISNMYDILDASKKQDFLENLDSFFGLRQINQYVWFDGAVVDTGLLYQNESREWTCLSAIAQVALIKFYVNKAKLDAVFSQVWILSTRNTSKLTLQYLYIEWSPAWLFASKLGKTVLITRKIN